MHFRAKRKIQNEVSISESLDTDGDGNALNLLDVVGVDDTMYADLQDKEDSVLIRRLVYECLTEREIEVIEMRFGLCGTNPQTQREVADKLGISRSYVSRIEKRALEKLREGLDGPRRH
jgi:RNA polymerase sporulation-specific sigma factor